jgi:hypothetical protein
MSTHPLALCIVATGLFALAASAVACGDVDFRGDAVTIQREVGATPTGQQATIQVIGAGWFHAAEVVKEGGSNDNTSVVLELDGEQLFSNSFATLKNPWMQAETRFFMATVRTVGKTSTMTIWYSPELKFRGIMAVRIGVQEDGVESLRIRAEMNKPAPHEHVGQAALALPAFK